jgi:hypothetical protein
MKEMKNMNSIFVKGNKSLCLGGISKLSPNLQCWPSEI